MKHPLLLLLASALFAAAAPSKPWTPEQANAWHAKQPWPAGAE